MKKITTFALLFTGLAIGWQANAQTYEIENFDAGIPVTWNIVDAGAATGDSWISGMQGGANNLDGTNGAVVDSDLNGNGTLMVESLESPAFNSSAATTLYLDFDQYYNWIGGDSALVQVYDGTNWVTVLSQFTADVGSFATPDQQHIDITAYANANMQIRFHYDDGNTWAWYWMIDNFHVYNSTCPQPTTLTANNILGNSADLSWVEAATATLWDIEWGTAGFVPTGTPTITGTTTNPHNLTGLAPATSYDYYVRADCGAGNTSIWVGPFTFMTTILCPAPTTQGVSNITTTTADLSWVETATATQWDIEWGTTGFAPTGTPTITGTTTNPHNLTGLTAATTYDFYVRADCGGASGQSPWIGPFSFTTTCAVFMAPYSETFDNNTDPNCWSQSATTGGPWVYGQLGSAAYGAANFDDNTGNGGYFAWIDFSGTDAGVVLEMPDVDVTSLTTPTLTFDMASYNIDNADSNILFVEAWDGAAWQQVSMIEQQDSIWIGHTYSLVGMTYGANLARVRFRGEPDANEVSAFYNDLLIDNVLIDGAVSVIENVTNINLNVYPNPSNGLITLNVNTTDVNQLEIKVINIQGQVVFSKNNFDNISNVNEQIDLSNNAKGIYFITVTTDNGVKTSKVIVQ